MSEFKKTALVLGAGGFIGSHMVKRLVEEGYWVRGVDLKEPEFSPSVANEFVVGDLRDPKFVERAIQFKGYLGNFYEKTIPFKHTGTFDEIYQFAADMGGAGFVFTGENDADIMHNSCAINLNVLEEQRKLNERYGDDWNQIPEHNKRPTKIFYSSSACMYPERNQLDPDNPDCREDSAYPAAPDSEYGWENSSVSGCTSLIIGITAFLLGLLATTISSDQKEPGTVEERKRQLQSAVKSLTFRRRVEQLRCGEMGLQTRSFLFIDECIEATRRLMDSDFVEPINIGSEEMVTINELVDTAARVAGKKVTKIHIDGPLGVRGRNSNNDLIREKLGWDYEQTLEEGIRKTYNWIEEQINK